MRGQNGRSNAAPSSPSVDALAAIAARKAAKIEKSLNKVPAMQRIADEIAKETVQRPVTEVETDEPADVDIETAHNSEPETEASDTSRRNESPDAAAMPPVAPSVPVKSLETKPPVVERAVRHLTLPRTA